MKKQKSNPKERTEQKPRIHTRVTAPKERDQNWNDHNLDDSAAHEPGQERLPKRSENTTATKR